MMEDLYNRLKHLGIAPEFVRRYVLAEWWEDSMAEVPANRALAEIAIARAFGLQIASLRDPSIGLKPDMDRRASSAEDRAIEAAWETINNDWGAVKNIKVFRVAIHRRLGREEA